MEKNCLHCGNTFTPKNAKGVYCSDKCRVYGNRKGSAPKQEPPIPPVTVTMPTAEPGRTIKVNKSKQYKPKKEKAPTAAKVAKERGMVKTHPSPDQPGIVQYEMPTYQSPEVEGSSEPTQEIPKSKMVEYAKKAIKDSETAYDRLYQPGDPKENTGNFFLKYGFMTYEEVENNSKS